MGREQRRGLSIDAKTWRAIKTLSGGEWDQEPGKVFQIKGQQVQGEEKARVHHQKRHIVQSSQQMSCDEGG